MANKDFKVKNGIDVATPIPVSMGGTGQTSTTNTLNSLLPAQAGNSSKVLQTDGTNTTWVTLPNGYQKGNTASRPGSPSIGDIYSNTETGYIEVYTASGWSQLGVIPTSAIIGTASDVGTNITYGSGATDVTFTAGSGGGLVTSFTAVSNPGNISAQATSSPIRVTGLTQGTSYNFTVTATNGYGNALASSASNSITPTSLPQSPTIGTPTNVTGVAYGSNTSASLTFTAGATGGKSITNYKYSTDGINYTAFSPAQTTSPLTIPGLVSGQSYTFRIKSINANGDSAESSQSASITTSTVPQAPTIGTATNLNTGGQASVSFTAGANGNSAITSYTVTSSPGNITASGSSSPITVSGLTNNTSYTFTIKATNANGQSEASASSNAVTVTTPYPLYSEFTTSGTYTPSSYPATVDIYLVGGGGTMGNTASTSSGNRVCIGWGGGGGGGYLTKAMSQTINSALTVTVGNTSNAKGQTGGTTSVSGGASYSAGGGNGGTGGGVSSINAGANTGTGGNGGSGGGAGSAVNADDANGSLWQIWYGGSGGTNGGNGGNVSMSTSNVGGSAGSQGIGSGVSYSPGGGGGGNFQNTAGATPGILVNGTYYLAERGRGGSESSQQRAGGVLVVRNA